MQLYHVPPKKRKKNKKTDRNKENPGKREVYTMDDDPTHDVKELN